MKRLSIHAFRLLGLMVLLTAPARHAGAHEGDPALIASPSPLNPANPPPDPWLDRAHQGLHGFVWRSARSIDSWMGPPLSETVYQEASGSVSMAFLWDEFRGFDLKVRFNVDLPLPRVNERLHLFIGRVNPDEFVSERTDAFGSIPPTHYGENDEDNTLAGLIYRRTSRNGSSFSGGAGGRINSGNPDPYVKASYQFQRTLWSDTLFTVRETVFYRVSEGFGTTTRLDFERMLSEDWRIRWTSSATLSEGSEGVRGYSNLTATRSFPNRRALIMRVGADGESLAPVPVRDFGVKVAYRASVLRPWLVLELRTSLTWPRHLQEQTRRATIGLGIGCEVYFGGEDFRSRPVTF